MSLTLPMTDRPALEMASDNGSRARMFWTACLLFVCVSSLLRFWPRDRWMGLSIWYYATPWGMLLALALITTIGCGWSAGKQGSQRRTVLAGLLSLVSLGMWLSSDWNWKPPPPMLQGSYNDRPVRLITWNVAHGTSGWDRIAREIMRYDADVVCLVEAGPSGAEMRRIWKSLLPDYDVSLLGGEVVCLVRGASGEAVAVDLTPNSRLRLVPVDVWGTAFTVAIVDIESSIFNERGLPLARLVSALEEVEGPLIIAGDFNTPTDSVHMTGIAARYRSAFRSVGSGYGATWPVPIPLLDLDQVWFNKQIFPVRHSLHGTGASDHRLVRFEFRVNETH